jgi:MFS family permease
MAGLLLIKFLPFWIFMVSFKFAGALHYSLISPFGEHFLPLWTVGLFMGGSSVVQLLLDVPAGRIMDRYGYRRFLLVTTAYFFVATICYCFGLNLATYVISIVFSTFGWLFFGPGVNAYALSHSNRATAGRFMSLRDVTGSIGVVLSSVALPFALLMSPTLVGWILSTLFVVSFAALCFAPKDCMVATAEEKISSQHFYVRRHSLMKALAVMKRLNPASGMLAVSGFAAGVFYGSIWFVLPLVMASKPDSFALGLGLGVFDFAVVVLGWALGALADRFNKRMLVFFGLLVFAVSASLTGFSFTWVFLIFGFLATSGDEMSGLSLWAWLHNLDKDHANDGAVSGIINVFSDAGWAVGPIVAGFVYAGLGPTWTIIASSLPIFATWIAYQTVMRGHSPQFLQNAQEITVPPKPHRPRLRS